MSEWKEISQPLRYIVELDAPLTIRRERSLLVQNDKEANTFVLEIYQTKGVEADLDGCKVSLSFIRPDNLAVPPIEASISENIASATLTESCYRLSGMYAALVSISKDGAERTILKVTGDMISTENSGTLSDESVLPSPDAIIETLQRLEAAIASANSAASAANTAAAGADKWANAEASAEKLASDADPTVTVEERDGVKHMIFGIPYGTGSFRTVGANGEYQTIQAAVDAAQDGDTIVVAPGTYVEKLKVHKNVKILGENRQKCILQATVEDYDNPPLEISQGEFGSFQVRGYDGGSPVNGSDYAYCLHTEKAVYPDGDFLYIHDVDFDNYVTQTVGIGMGANFSLRFDDCTFTCHRDLAAFYCHSSVNGGIDQNLYVNRCMFRNAGTNPIILMQSQNISGAYALCEWVDCKAIPRATEVVGMVNWDGSSGHSGWLGSADWNISGFSMGSNIAKLNAWGSNTTFDPEDFGNIVYIGYAGVLTPLTLGDGLSIVDGVLTINNSAQAAETE